VKPERLCDKTVIITGAGGGIGAATVRLLDREGARLVLADIDLSALEDISGKLSRPALTVKCDVTSRQDIEQLVAQVREQYKTADVLVNTAESSSPRSSRIATVRISISRLQSTSWGRLTPPAECCPC